MYACHNICSHREVRGFAKETKFQKSEFSIENRLVGPGLTLNFFFGKSSQYSSKPVLIF